MAAAAAVGEMNWDQTLVLLVLILSSGAGAVKDRWLLVTVLWMNFSATFVLDDLPIAVGVVDMMSAAILLKFGSKREYYVVAIFAAMIVIYRFEQQLGRVLLFDIVNLMACAQFTIMGGGGFGQLYRNIQSLIRDLRRTDSCDPVGARRDGGAGDQGNLDVNKKCGVSK